MVERRVKITNKYGMHVRPSTQFSRAADGFRAKITVIVPDGRVADGTSLLQVLSLGIQGNTEITIVAKGEDEQEAIDTLCQMVANQFGLRYDE